MPVRAGASVLHYRVVEKIGAGGMVAFQNTTIDSAIVFLDHAGPRDADDRAPRIATGT